MLLLALLSSAAAWTLSALLHGVPSCSCTCICPLHTTAAAAVVSLWSVDDGSTAALMAQMYRHLVDGRTVPQALRLAMLHLALSPSPENTLQSDDPSCADGLCVEWKRPMHWAGFLVMGASTRLPLD